MSTKWDQRFLSLARFIASWSKDPSSKVGAVIVDRDNRIISTGYNGFAIGVNDSPARLADRETKYKFVIHAEPNAIMFAKRDLKDCTIYTWPFAPCVRCAPLIIQTGITRVVCPPANPRWKGDWLEDTQLVRQMFDEAKVGLNFKDLDDESKNI